MRYIFTISIFLLLQISNSYAQTTWVVSNMPGFPATFTNLQVAINDSRVVEGDILLVQGSDVNYGDVEVTKKVIIMGPGYFLSENAETQTNQMSAKLNSVHFLPNSEGSIMQGLEVTGTSVTETFYHFCNGFSGNNYSVLIDAKAVSLISNYLHQALVVKNAPAGMVLKNYLNYFMIIDNTSLLTISNNIINGDFTAKNSSVTNNIIDAEGAGRYIELSNCTIDGNIFYGNSIASNCGNVSIYTKNIFTNNPLGEDVGNNIVDVPQPDIFVWTQGQLYKSTDGRFKIKPNSPAATINAGVFAGVDPYKLSGISLHPNIFSVTMPNTATSGSGLKIEVKVRAND